MSIVNVSPASVFVNPFTIATRLCYSDKQQQSLHVLGACQYDQEAGIRETYTVHPSLIYDVLRPNMIGLKY